MLWATVLEKTVLVQSTRKLCVVKDLNAHDIVMRLMRKDNYLIGMLNKGVLAFPISKWIPGAGLTVKSSANGTQYRLVLTKTLEWTLNWCILQSMFDRYVNYIVKIRIPIQSLYSVMLGPITCKEMAFHHLRRNYQIFFFKQV